MADGGLYDVGIVSYVVEFQLFALPVRHAIDDENHPLISIHDYPINRIMDFGITPLGALSCQTKNGANLKTANGVVTADGLWHTASCLYDPTGDLLITLDNLVGVGATDSGGFLLPGNVARLRLFNGPDGIARTDVAIRRVEIATSDGTPRVCTYLFTEKSGTALAGTKDSGDFPDVFSFDLLAEFMTPLGYAPMWGPVPTVGLADAYRWMLDTEYEDITPAPTEFEEMEVL
jgi:hypothetical protein